MELKDMAELMTSMPEDMKENIDWVWAVDAYDYNYPEALSELITESEQIPDMLRVVIADIIQGKRQPNRKAATKLIIPANKRMALGIMLVSLLELLQRVKKHTVVCADGLGIEPIELRRKIEAEASQLIDNTANDYGVSVETIENIVRDFRKKIKDWPNV